MKLLRLTLVLLFLLPAFYLFGMGETETAEGEVTLRIMIWSNPATTEALEELNKRFMEEYPDIKVELAVLEASMYESQVKQTRVQANDVDIWADFGFFLNVQDYHEGAELYMAYQFIKAGLVEPLDGQPFIDRFTENTINDAMTYEGHVYGICMGSVVFSGIFYNKGMFEEYGLEKPETYDELINVCETLKSNGITPFSAAGAAVWPVNMMIHGFMGPLIEDQYKLEKDFWTGNSGWDDPRILEAYERYHRLITNYYEDGFQSLDYNTHISRFSNENVAMLPDGMWLATAIADANPDLDFGYMPIPSSDNTEDNKVYFGKYDLMWMVHANSPNKDAAMKWLDFMSRPDNYAYFINKVGWVPTQPGVTVDNDIVEEISQYPMKTAWERIHISKQGLGQYGTADFGFLTPLGVIESAEELLGLAKQAWDSVD